LQKHPNLRMTRQRRVILEELRKVNTHPSADEVYEIVRKRLPRISLGTVYRNLEILSEYGDIQKLEPGCSLKRFDGNSTEHCHIRCVCCGRIADAPMTPDLEIDLKRVNSSDFDIIGHRLEFLGVCPICSDKAKRDANREL
jgi:Fur family transcriptional regulator, peroxide stress response regulator